MQGGFIAFCMRERGMVFFFVGRGDESEFINCEGRWFFYWGYLRLLDIGDCAGNKRKIFFLYIFGVCQLDRLVECNTVSNGILFWAS